MDADARALIALLAQALGEHRTRHWHDERHQENCSHGLWLGVHASGDGVPCSEKCQRGADALRAAEAYLAAHPPATQQELLADGTP